MELSSSVVREHDRAAPDPSETETATFGLGCFWGPDARFGALEGVVRTRVRPPETAEAERGRLGPGRVEGRPVVLADDAE